MKRILLFIFFLNCVLLPAQNRIAQEVSELQKRGANFKAFTILQTKTNQQDAQVSQVVNDATLATVDLSKVNEILKINTKPSNFKFLTKDKISKFCCIR
jgi:hypothetical protein